MLDSEFATGAKVGIHSLRANDAMDFVRDLHRAGGRFPVVKAVNDIDWLIEVKALDSQIVTIGRMTLPDEGLQQIEFETDMRARATYLFEPILEKLRLNPDLRANIDYWEICNEPDPPHEPPEVLGYKKLGECMIACMEMADELDLKLAILGLNAGTPEWDEMVSLADSGVFGIAKQGGHIVTLHEGVFSHFTTGEQPPVDLWFGHLIPGSPTVEGAGALCFRYRYLYHILKQRDEVVPLVISETYYGSVPGSNNFSVDESLARIQWYDAQASKDSYVLAHLPFTLGGYGSTRGWRSANYKVVYPAIIDYMATVQQSSASDVDSIVKVEDGNVDVVVADDAPIDAGSESDSAEPVATTDPQTPELELDNTIGATFNLLPSTLEPAELWIVASTIYEERETLGFSADSAGIHTHNRWPSGKIITWAPERLGERGTQAWFNNNYGGVQMGRKWFGAPLSPAVADGVAPLETKQLPQASATAHIYHLLPTATSLSDYWSLLRRVYKEGGTVGFSAESGAKLVASGTPQSKLIIWHVPSAVAEVTTEWAKRRYPSINVDINRLQHDQWD